MKDKQSRTSEASFGAEFEKGWVVCVNCGMRRRKDRCKQRVFPNGTGYMCADYCIKEK